MKHFPVTACVSILLALGAARCDAPGPTETHGQPDYDVIHSDGVLPFYARLERPFVIHTAEWAAVVFYRPPSCVRPDFNLLDFFDVPGAFSCAPQTVAVSEMRKDPDPFVAPFQATMKGLGAVPVWLFSWSELRAALSDDMVTMAELQSLPSLAVGTATRYEELLQPTPTRTGHLVMNAVGTLADGRTFLLHSTVSGHSRTVQIGVW